MKSVRIGRKVTVLLKQVLNTVGIEKIEISLVCKLQLSTIPNRFRNYPLFLGRRQQFSPPDWLFETGDALFRQ